MPAASEPKRDVDEGDENRHFDQRPHHACQSLAGSGAEDADGNGDRKLWHTRATIVVNTFSVAHFHVSLKRGHTYTVRIYLPQRQSGPGYLDGSSHIRRVGGNS